MFASHPPGRPDFHHWEGAAAPFAGLLGFLMILLLLAAALGAFWLVRQGKLSSPPWLRGRSTPEFEARKVLAERFARGDISPDEFMERASVLNWTPGVDTQPRKGRGRTF